MLDHQSTSDPQVPQNGKAAIYARVATSARGIYAPQKDDVLALAKKKGCMPEQITVYEDVGVSGNTPIENRKGLRALVTAIQQGSIQTVFTFAEDRLFKSRCERATLFIEREVQKRLLTGRMRKRETEG